MPHGPKHHATPEKVTVPAWARKLPDGCLLSVTEEVYQARALAHGYGAELVPQCGELLAAAEKSLARLADPSLGEKARTQQGERALRKFWEAKACARRVRGK